MDILCKATIRLMCHMKQPLRTLTQRHERVQVNRLVTESDLEHVLLLRHSGTSRTLAGPTPPDPQSERALTKARDSYTPAVGEVTVEVWRPRPDTRVVIAFLLH